MRMENVWDYPRPPALVPCERRVRVELGGATIADSTRALRVLETSHPPTIYIPPADVAPSALRPAAGSSLCEFKGRAAFAEAAELTLNEHERAILLGRAGATSPASPPGP